MKLLIRKVLPTLNKIISILESDIDIKEIMFGEEWFASRYNLDLEQTLIAFTILYHAKYIKQYLIVECTACSKATDTYFEYSMRNSLDAMSNFKCNHCGNTKVLQTEDKIVYKFNPNIEEREI